MHYVLNTYFRRLPQHTQYIIAIDHPDTYYQGYGPDRTYHELSIKSTSKVQGENEWGKKYQIPDYWSEHRKLVSYGGLLFVEQSLVLDPTKFPLVLENRWNFKRE